MTNENTNQSEQSGSEIADELNALGLHLKEMLRTAWESPERKKIQQEIEAGLSDLGETINSAAIEFNESPTGQTLRADVEDIKERFRSGEVDTKIREEILKALRIVNTELEKATQTDTEPSGEDTPQQAEEG
jgi:hypothetical protein